MLIYSPAHKLDIFIEYINSLLIYDSDCYKTWKMGDTIDINDDHNIVIFLQVFPNQCNNIIFNNTKKINIFICNTEQASANSDALIFNINPLYNHVKHIPVINFGIIDYSQQNIDILKNNQFVIDFDIQLYHIPYQYNKKEIDELKTYSSHDKKIFMCGSLSERRKNILTMMRNLYGLNIDVISGFYEKRDKSMMKYKAMFNMSAFDDYNIYEHIRCDRLIFAGMIIISEHKIDCHMIDIYDLVIWCDINDFPTVALDVLKNYKFYKDNISITKITKIANNRRKIYLNFRSKFEY